MLILLKPSMTYSGTAVNNNPSENDKSVIFFYSVLGLVYCFYVVGAFSPESLLWGVNHLAFVPLGARIVVLLCSGVLLLPNVSLRVGEWVVARYQSISPRIKHPNYARLVVALTATAFFYILRIQTDMYGDSRSLLKYLSEKTFTLSDIFDYRDFEPLTRWTYQRLGVWLSINQKMAIQLIATLTGGIYVYVISDFLSRLKSSNHIKVIAYGLFLAGGSIQLFFGHVEDYSLLFLALTLIFITAWKYYETGEGFWVIPVVFIVGLRLHALTGLLLPSMLLLALDHYRNKVGGPKRFSRLSIAGYGLAVSFVLTTAAYFFLFKAHHFVPSDKAAVIGKIFLPLQNDIANLNGYTIQSAAHLNDVLQSFFLSTHPVSLIVLAVALVARKYSPSAQPMGLFITLAAFYFILFAATANPILSYPRDWDLFAVTSVPLTFLSLSVLIEFDKVRPGDNYSKRLVAVVIALSTLTTTYVVVNSVHDYANLRIRSIGMWVFRSYHGNASYLVNVGCQNIGDLNGEIVERKRILTALEQDKIVEDVEYSFLEQKLAEALYLNGEYEASKSEYESSIKTARDNSGALKGYGILQLKMGLFKQGVRSLDEYNTNYNDPNVQDQWALIAVEYGHLLSLLQKAKVDTTFLHSRMNAIESVLR